MKDKLAEEILRIIQATEKVAVEQLPDIVSQLLAWEFWSGVVGGIFEILIASVILISCYKTWSKTKFNDTRGEPKADTVPIASAIAIFFVLSLFLAHHGFFQNLTTAAKIYFAPKVWLLEYLRGML